MPSKKGAPKPNKARDMMVWFVTTILEREVAPEDYKSKHMAHAKRMIIDYGEEDVRGCLLAMEKGLLKARRNFKVTTISQVSWTDEDGSPFIRSYREYRDQGPVPVYSEYYRDLWQTVTGRQWNDATA